MTSQDFIGKLETRILGRDNRNLTPKEKQFLYQISLTLPKEDRLRLLGLASRIRK